MPASPHSLTRLVMHFAAGLLDDMRKHFEDQDRHTHMRRVLKTSILTAYQLDLASKGNYTRNERRIPEGWVVCKIFLDHDFMDIFIKVLKSHMGSNFAVTYAAIEQIFNKTESLPVSHFFSTDHELTADPEV